MVLKVFFPSFLQTSLRELLHSKQMQDAKVAAMAQIHQQYQAGTSDQAGGSRSGSRSSSPSVNLKTLLETQTREALKIGPHRTPNASDMACLSFAAAAAGPRHISQQQQSLSMMQNFQQQNGKNSSQQQHPNQPMLYPHILNRPQSPPTMRERAASDASVSMMRGGGGGHHSSPAHSVGLFKHKKLLEWTAADVRDWVSTLTYCSEFADVRKRCSPLVTAVLIYIHYLIFFGFPDFSAAIRRWSCPHSFE